MIENFAPIIQAMKGKNPQAILMDMMKNSPMNSNPMFVQLINYAKAGDNNGLLNFANSYFSQRGIDINKEFNTLMSMLK